MHAQSVLTLSSFFVNIDVQPNPEILQRASQVTFDLGEITASLLTANKIGHRDHSNKPVFCSEDENDDFSDPDDSKRERSLFEIHPIEISFGLNYYDTVPQVKYFYKFYLYSQILENFLKS